VKVLVTGVTGKVGGAVAHSLVNRGVGVRALVRDVERAKMATLGMGVELFEGDYDNSASVREAVDDCDSMFIVTADNSRQVHQEIQLARIGSESGIEHVVKLSSSDAGQRSYAWSVAHAEIEAEISKVGVPYSFLRPHFFMANYFSLIKVDSSGSISLEAPAGDGLIGAIDTFDIGEAAAAVLAENKPLNTHALLTGPENISMSRVAEAFSSATGKSIEYVDIDPNAYLAELAEVDSDSAGDVSDVYAEVRDGTMALLSDNVQRITGAVPRTIEQFAAENVSGINSAIVAASAE